MKTIPQANVAYRTHHRSVAAVDAEALAALLRRNIRGEVRFDAGSRALYATGGSNYRQVPAGVVIPRDLEDVLETVAAARRFGAPVLARGGGTSGDSVFHGCHHRIAVPIWTAPLPRCHLAERRDAAVGGVSHGFWHRARERRGRRLTGRVVPPLPE